MLVGKSEAKRLLRKEGRKYVNNIKIYLREIGWAGID
jgi:hypothetical protein